MKVKKNLPPHPVVEKLRKIISSKLITQRAMADFAGISDSQFSKILSGKIQVSVWQLSDIAKGLHMEIQDLFTYPNRAEKPEPAPKQEPQPRTAPAPSPDSVVLPREVWQVIQRQSESLAAKDAQLSELIAAMKKKPSAYDPAPVSYGMVAETPAPYGKPRPEI